MTSSASLYMGMIHLKVMQRIPLLSKVHLQQLQDDVGSNFVCGIALPPGTAATSYTRLSYPQVGQKL